MRSAALERKLRALKLGKECKGLGASARTICYVTALSRKEVVREFFDASDRPKSGKPPASSEWLYKVNLFGHIEASVLVAMFGRLRDLGIADEEALVTAFKEYRARFGVNARIDFNRAFDIVSHCWGAWLELPADLALYTCCVCHSQYVAALGDSGGGERNCPFCKVLTRWAKEERVREYFPERQIGRATPISIGGLALCAEPVQE